MTLRQRFLRYSAKISTTKKKKKKRDKLDFVKIENCCSSKATIKRMNRQVTTGEKIFANHISDKGLISRMNKGNLQLNYKKKTQFKKWAKKSKYASLQGRYTNN